MPVFTINTKTGMFVQGGGPRRSPRLARAGTVRVVPRVTVVPEVPEVPVPVAPAPVPAPVPVVPPTAAPAPPAVRKKRLVFRAVAPPLDVCIGYSINQSMSVYIRNRSDDSRIVVPGMGVIVPSSTTVVFSSCTDGVLFRKTLIFEEGSYECVVTEKEVTLTRLLESVPVPASLEVLQKCPYFCIDVCCAEEPVPIRVLEPPVAVVAAAPVKVRRRSPRLVAYNAARDAIEARQKEFLESVRATIAARRREELQRITDTLRVLIDRAALTKATKDVTAVMEFVLTEARMPELFAATPQTLLQSVVRMAQWEKPAPALTQKEELRLLCQKVIDKYGPSVAIQEFNRSFMDRWAAAKYMVGPTAQETSIAALIRWVYDCSDCPQRFKEAAPVVLEIIRSIVTSVSDTSLPSHRLVCEAVLKEMTK